MWHSLAVPHQGAELLRDVGVLRRGGPEEQEDAAAEERDGRHDVWVGEKIGDRCDQPRAPRRLQRGCRLARADSRESARTRAEQHAHLLPPARLSCHCFADPRSSEVPLRARSNGAWTSSNNSVAHVELPGAVMSSGFFRGLITPER